MPFIEPGIQPYYPMMVIGTEFYYSRKERSELFQTVNIACYYSKYSTSSVMAFSEIAYRYKFPPGLFVDGALGIGYAHLFRPNAVYTQNDNGDFQQLRDWGAPGLLADFSFSIGYNFSAQNIPLSLYLRYANYIDVLYAPDIPVLPHNSFQLGVSFLLKSNR